MNMVKTTCNTTEDMNKELQMLKGKTKMKFYKNKSNNYDEINIRNFKFEEDTFLKMLKVFLLLIMKFYY